MNLIYISHWRFPSEKTMSPLVMKECEMFARSGVGVELWVPWRQNSGFAREEPFSYHRIARIFRIRRLPSIDFTAALPGSFFFFLMLATFYVSAFCYACARRIAPDTFFYFHDARDALLLSFLGRPRYLEVHDFYKSKISALNYLVFERMTGFIVTNRIKMAALERDFHIASSRMLYCPNGVDLEMFGNNMSRDEARRRLALPLREKIILYTGHLFYWKGADMLFEAKKFLRADEKIYFVGGTDEDIQKFKVKSEKLNVANVVIAGRRPHGEIPLWLRAADILVLPSPAKFEASRVETSPVKLFEYMASGRPIVASDVPSIRDVVSKKEVFFAKPDDPESFAEAIHRIIEDPEEAEARSLRAREAVKPFSWERRTERVIDFIRQTSVL